MPPHVPVGRDRRARRDLTFATDFSSLNTLPYFNLNWRRPRASDGAARRPYH
jgi:hypothetical protein